MYNSEFCFFGFGALWEGAKNTEVRGVSFFMAQADGWPKLQTCKLYSQDYLSK